MTQLVRLLASVGPQAGPLKTRHALGLPWGRQEPMSFPRLLLIEPSTESGWYLFRYTADGDDCGDTWHESLENAKEQAAFEYESALGEWYDVPAHVEDPVSYAHAVGLISRPEV